MALLKLDELPMEVLQAITQLLDASHKPSVASFSLANRTCRRATAWSLFRKIDMRITTPYSRSYHAERWHQILLANDSFRYVREVLISEDRSLQVLKRLAGLDAPTREQRDSADKNPWEQLAKLLEELPGLRDVYFYYSSEFPSCLLTSITRGYPACRLHISNFGLVGLKRGAPIEHTQPLVLPPQDVALATSTNLYSVAFTLIRSKSYGSGPGFTPDAIFEIVARACPALRKVEVVQKVNARPQYRGKTPYPGLKFDQTVDASIRPTSSKARLTSLALRGSQLHLQQWERHTDLAVLETLKLTGYLDADIVHWAAESGRFPALSCLEIQKPLTDGPSVVRLLSCLPCLKDIRMIDKWREPTITAIRQQHGSTLQRLSLSAMSLSIHDLTLLRDECPQLSQLATVVTRTQGDANEVAIYTTLGTFPRLQTLHLNLSCAITVTDETTMDAETKTRCMRSSLINCAIDSTLAACIFDAIARAKPHTSTPLHTVELNVARAGILIGRLMPCERIASHTYYFKHFERTWICTRHPRDDCQGCALAVEQKASRLARERQEPGSQLLELGGDLEGAFRELWPETSGDWREDWRSFGLHES